MQADGTWTVLVVDDDDAARAALIRCFEDDYRVLATVSVRDAMSIQDTEEVDAVLCAQRVASASGVEFFREMRISHPEAIRILITESMDHDEMIRSINDAAVYQIVPAPWNADHMHLLVKRALESRELARRHRYLSRELKFADTVLRRQNDRMAKLLSDSYEFD